RDLFARTAQSSTRAVIAVSFLGAGALVAVAPAAEAVFSQRNDTTGMTMALTLMAPGVIGLALIFHLSRALFSLDRQRSAVAATGAGWLVVTLAAVVGVQLVAPEGGRPAATLGALGLAHTIGMTAAGVGLLRASIGALAGRWATTVVLDLAGTSMLAAVLAGALGAILAAAGVAGAVGLADRGILSTLRRTRA